MKRVLKWFREVGDAFLALGEVAAAEIRTGVTLFEGVHADEFETKLRTVTTTAGQREDARRWALHLSMAGATNAQVEVFAKIVASGRITNGDMAMLRDRGIAERSTRGYGPRLMCPSPECDQMMAEPTPYTTVGQWPHVVGKRYDCTCGVTFTVDTKEATDE